MVEARQMTKKTSDVYRFEKSYETDGIILYPVGRLQLASGNIVRIVFTPDGLKLGLSEGSKDNGDIFWVEKVPHETTLGKLYGQKEGK